MVDGISGGGATRAAIEAALKSMRSRATDIGASDAGPRGVASLEDASLKIAAEGSDFASKLKEGVSSVEASVERTNELHIDVLEGRLDIHEVAAQLKETEITFQFALQVRNKLLDAYREVMRMSV